MSTSAFYNQPSRYQADAERADRIAAGAALCRSVLAAAEARRPTPDGEMLTERERIHQRCREIARADRRARQQRQRGTRTDGAAAAPLAETVAAIVHKARQSTGGTNV